MSELEARIKAEIGTGGLVALREGRTEVLEQALPSRIERLAIAEMYVFELAEREGSADLAQRATELQDALALEERALRAAAELADDRILRRDRRRDLDLGDGMDLQ